MYNPLQEINKIQSWKCFFDMFNSASSQAGIKNTYLVSAQVLFRFFISYLREGLGFVPGRELKVGTSV